MISEATVAQQYKTGKKNEEVEGNEEVKEVGTKDTILEAIEKEVLPIPGESGFPDLKPHQNVPTSGSNEEMKKNGAPFHS